MESQYNRHDDVEKLAAPLLEAGKNEESRVVVVVGVDAELLESRLFSLTHSLMTLTAPFKKILANSTEV